MKMEECHNDPKFRVAFVEEHIRGLNSIMDNNNNAIYHNESSISILEEIKQTIELQESEIDVVNEHLNALRTVNKDLSKQKDRLKIMVDIYEKFLSFKSNKKLKLIK